VVGPVPQPQVATERNPLASRKLYQKQLEPGLSFVGISTREREAFGKLDLYWAVMKSFTAAALGLALGISAFVATSAQPQTRGGLTIEQLVDIRHPSNAMWAPDGRHVVFMWDRAGVSKVYVVDLAGAGQTAAPRELTQAGAQLGGAFWSSDGRALMIPRSGDLLRVPIDGSAASAGVATPCGEARVVPAAHGSRGGVRRSQSAAG